MKIRQGFVSNSSSSSFVCYGWKDYQITKDKQDEIRKRIALLTLSKFGGNESFGDWYRDSEGDRYIGVGDTDSEMDHYMDDWRDYQIEYNKDFAIKAVDQVAQEYNLPKPQWFRETWYDG